LVGFKKEVMKTLIVYFTHNQIKDYENKQIGRTIVGSRGGWQADWATHDHKAHNHLLPDGNAFRL